MFSEDKTYDLSTATVSEFEAMLVSTNMPPPLAREVSKEFIDTIDLTHPFSEESLTDSINKIVQSVITNACWELAKSNQAEILVDEKGEIVISGCSAKK